MTSNVPAEVLKDLETVGVAVEPALPTILEVASHLPGLSFLSIVERLLPALLPAIAATGGDVQAVADHLDPTKPADPRLSKQ